MFRWKYLLMDAAKDGDGGGGGSGGEGDKGADSSKQLSELLEQNKSLLARLDALEGKKKEDPDFNDKVKKHRDDEQKKTSDSKQIESALKFTLSSQEFLKTNAALLPKNVTDIFTVAEKEKYDSATEKASDIKSGLIHAFFSVQDNMNLLTASQKEAVEDYLKLTKNGRQQDAHKIYDSIFEPTLEMLKRIKKQEQVNKARNGFGDGTDDSYKQKLIGLSKKHYLGEK